jgi:hypothetical protein
MNLRVFFERRRECLCGSLLRREALVL